MSSPRELAAFMSRLRFEDLPPDVVAGTHRMILDTLGCAISARATEAGPVSKQFASMLGGTDAAAGQAYYYGRLGDAMDFNEGCVGAHFGAASVAAALALAREPGITGRDMLLAVAAGYELAGRIQEAIGTYYTTVGGKQSFAPVWGIATPLVYAAVGTSARLLGLSPELTEQAWGLAGSCTPIPVGAKWSAAVDLPNTKYCDSGWCSLAGVSGALSARFGSTGLTSLLDDEAGLVRMVSAADPALDKLYSRLGERWCIRQIVYKEWPVCGLLEGPMLLLRRLMSTHNLKPRSIERIHAEVGNAILVPRFTQSNPRTFASLQFNLPHALAMMLLDVPPGPAWLSTTLAARPDVAALRQRVTMSEHRLPWVGGRQRHSSLRIEADRRSYALDSAESGPADDPRAWTDECIRRKFMSLVEAPEARTIADIVMNLEDIESPVPLLDVLDRASPTGASAS